MVAARGLGHFLFGLILVGGLGAFGGCGSDSDSGSGGAGGSGAKDGGPDGSTAECIVSSDCDDQNACTIESCTSGKCESILAPDGDALDQEEGDCKRIECKGGNATTKVDNGDVPDDKEQCTLDTCEAGVPSNKPLLNGTKCNIGNGSGTCSSGVCYVLCTPADEQSQCNDLNSCTKDACVPCNKPECQGKGQCQNQGLSGMPTPGASQTEGDCHEQRCVEGEDTDAIDNYDIPEDGNDCTNDVCKNGEPANPPIAAGTQCSTNGGSVCDGAGKCVDCMTAADCPTSTNTCYQPACNIGTCTTAPAPAGTVLPSDQQSPGDCKVYVCDGSGSTTSKEDPTDVQDDNNACTKDECSGTSPLHTKLPLGTSCGTSGEICNASGYCCTPTTCTQANKKCGSMANGCGQTVDCGTCPTGQTCTTTGQCCTPKTCVAGKSCGSQSDGCGGTIVCGTCSAGDTCIGGTCGCGNGYQNGSETDVDCGGFCAQKCTQGQKCLATSDCTTGFCADGVCCDSACSGACKGCTSVKTGATTGTCANIKDATDPDNECPTTLATTCGTTGMCKAGACEYHPAGTACSTATCSGATEYPADSCNGSGTCVDSGAIACTNSYVCYGTKCGSCTDNVKNGAESGVDCGGTSPCPKCANGKQCTTGTDCTSGNCVDGYCCNTACTGTCMACNLGLNAGTCTNIPNNQDPADECPGLKLCNGAGACQ